MKNENKTASASFDKRRLYRILAAVCIVIVLIPLAGVLGKYISTRIAEGNVKAALFVAQGDYAYQIPSDGTVPEINVSGWSEDGIVLTLYNHEGDRVSGVDMTYSCSVSGGWTASEPVTLKGGTKGQATITLTPPADAARGDRVSFVLTTAPFEIKLQATFVLTDSNVPDWTLEDKGAYMLLTVHTNDYRGPITVSYDGRVYAPDSTDPLMEEWDRSGSGSFDGERFTTYQLRLFEEVPGTYTEGVLEGTGYTITVTATEP